MSILINPSTMVVPIITLLGKILMVVTKASRFEVISTNKEAQLRCFKKHNLFPYLEKTILAYFSDPKYMGEKFNMKIIYHIHENTRVHI